MQTSHASQADQARGSADGPSRASQDVPESQRLSRESAYSVSRSSQQSWRRSQRRRSRQVQGMILPFEPLSFTFDHISYSVPASGVSSLIWMTANMTRRHANEYAHA